MLLLLTVIMIQLTPMVLLYCHNPKLTMSLIQDNKLVGSFSTGGVRPWIHFLLHAIFKDNAEIFDASSSAVRPMLICTKSNMGVSSVYIVNAISRILAVDNFFILALHIIVLQFMPLLFLDAQVLQASAILTCAGAVIFVIAIVYTSMQILQKENFVEKLFTITDFIQYAVEDKYGEGSEQTINYMFMVHHLINLLGHANIEEWFHKISLDEIINDFEVNQKTILNHTDSPVEPERVNRKNPSTWSIWLKQFIGQSILSSLMAFFTNEPPKDLSVQDRASFDALMACCPATASNSESSLNI